MQTHSLRDYQEDAVETLWSGIKTRPRQLCVLPTGTGKTEIFKELILRAHQLNKKTVVLVNRNTLVAQFISRFSSLNPSIYSAGQKRKESDGHLVIASIQSSFSTHFDADLLILDEAHNLSNSYYKFLEANERAKVIGFTATPYRDTGYIYGKDQFFDKVDFFRSMNTMIDDGWIVSPKSKAPPHAFDLTNVKERMGDYVIEDLEKITEDTGKIKEQVRDALPRLVNRNKIVWTCVSIKHAEMLKKEIQNFEDCSIIHSKQNAFEQELNLKAFEKGPHRHLVSITMVSEGYNFDPIDAIILMRPTKSARLYVQVVGRGLRLYPDKKDCLVLDYGDVIKNLGPVTNPLVIKEKRKKEKCEPSLIKLCPSCFEVVLIEVKFCDCGHSWPEAEPTKNLKIEAADFEILREQSRELELGAGDIAFSKHIAKASGNPCVRVDYKYGLFNKVSEFISSHPFAWGKHKYKLEQLTGCYFKDFDAAYNVASDLFCTADKVIIEVYKDGKWDKIKTVKVIREPNRAPDPSVPF